MHEHEFIPLGNRANAGLAARSFKEAVPTAPKGAADRCCSVGPWPGLRAALDVAPFLLVHRSMNTLPGRRSAVIHIFLADGLPDGLREVEKLGWTGHALVCPRSRFPEAKAQEEFARTGVYVLVGPSEEGDLPAVYIGEGDPTRPRLEQHYREKDFWTSLIVFTSKDKNLNKAHVQYLESRLVALARGAKRSVLDNGNTPQLPTLARPDAAAMETFLEEMLLIYPLLGLTAFEAPLHRRLYPRPMPRGRRGDALLEAGGGGRRPRVRAGRALRGYWRAVRR